MEDWNDMMGAKVFITDLGCAQEAEVSGQKTILGRYAVWSPMQGAKGHAIVEVGDDLTCLMERYHVPADRVCVLTR